MAKLNNSMILIELTVNIVSSHVSNNSVTPDSLPDFIKNVHASLSAATAKKHDFSDNPPQPAVPIRKSVSDDYLICLEDGKKLKMLRRHLKRAYGMTPELCRQAQRTGQKNGPRHQARPAPLRHDPRRRRGMIEGRIERLSRRSFNSLYYRTWTLPAARL